MDDAEAESFVRFCLKSKLVSRAKSIWRCCCNRPQPLCSLLNPPQHVWMLVHGFVWNPMWSSLLLGRIRDFSSFAFFFSLFNFSFLVDFRQKFEQWKLAFNNDSINDDSRISGEEFLWIWEGSSFKIKFFEMIKKDEEFLWECSIEFY